MIKELLHSNFAKFRKHLIFFAIRFNISFEDAEEIVNDTILKALNYFDEDKGSFEALCKVILKNKLINFNRKYKDAYLLVSLDDDNKLGDIYKFLIEQNEFSNLHKQCIDTLNGLICKLDAKEKEFLNVIYQNTGIEKKISVSKAARDLNLSPQEGWNLFRRIQRKAKKHFDEPDDLTSSSDYFIFKDNLILYCRTTESEMDRVPDISEDYLIGDIKPESHSAFDKYELSNIHFMEKLTKEQLQKLHSIYK